VAKQLGIIVRGFAPQGVITDLPMLMETLQRYENVLEPWAQAVSERMVAEVNQRDKNAWHAQAIEIGQRLRNEIESAPTGHVMQRLMSEQIREITSLPRAAAERIYALATEAHISGTRSSEIAAEIMRTEEVSAARAKMIAKTAVSTASTSLVEARAQYVGSPGYYWRTSQNEDVRKDHKILEGKFFTWNDPPVVDRHSGFRSHPGCNANCQCWAEVVLPAPELR
jgi:SPP1 gp7 family putative phage head morphogenesis protein